MTSDLADYIRTRLETHRQEAERMVTPADDVLTPQPEIRQRWLDEADSAELIVATHSERKGRLEAAEDGRGTSCREDGDPYPCNTLRRLGDQWSRSDPDRAARYDDNPRWIPDGGLPDLG